MGRFCHERFVFSLSAMANALLTLWCVPYSHCKEHKVKGLMRRNRIQGISLMHRGKCAFPPYMLVIESCPAKMRPKQCARCKITFSRPPHRHAPLRNNNKASGIVNDPVPTAANSNSTQIWIIFLCTNWPQPKVLLPVMAQPPEHTKDSIYICGTLCWWHTTHTQQSTRALGDGIWGKGD
jgi:hypothetical protein